METPRPQDLGFCPSIFRMRPCSQVLSMSARAPDVMSISFSQEKDGHRMKGIDSAELTPLKEPFWKLYPVTYP